MAAAVTSLGYMQLQTAQPDVRPRSCQLSGRSGLDIKGNHGGSVLEGNGCRWLQGIECKFDVGARRARGGRGRGGVCHVAASSKLSPATTPTHCEGGLFLADQKPFQNPGMWRGSGGAAAEGRCRRGEMTRQQRQGQRRQRRRGDSIVAWSDDFEGDDEDGGFDEEDLDMDDDGEMEVEDRDLLGEMEGGMVVDLGVESYTVGEGGEGGGDDGGQGEREIVRVDFEIDEKRFHKIELFHADFFIRRAEDVDGDVYDFSEIYVSDSGSREYFIPRKYGALPAKPIRCNKSNWTYLAGKLLPPSSDPYKPQARTVEEVTKVFLMKHFRNRRSNDDGFVLDLEEIYILDGQDKSVRRADVTVAVDTGPGRDRTKEVLTVRDDGNSFRIIPAAERRYAEDIIEEVRWLRTREEMEAYLRGFRDYDKSNWF